MAHSIVLNLRFERVSEALWYASQILFDTNNGNGGVGLMLRNFQQKHF